MKSCLYAEDQLLVKVLPDSTIALAAEQAIHIANMLNCEVKLEFNGYLIIIDKYTIINDVLTAYCGPHKQCALQNN